MSDEAGSDPLRQLLARVGRRPEPPEETREAVYLTTLIAWHDTVRRRRRLRVGLLALAATATAAVFGLSWFRMQAVGPAPALAATVTLGPGEATSTSPARTFRVGDAIVTPAKSGIVLSTIAGHSLRLAGGTRARFTATDRLRLDAGRVYFESTTQEGFGIDSRFGAVSHVGTSYALELRATELIVRVREGLVAIATRAAHVRAPRGTQVAFDAQGHELGRSTISTWGPVWSWADVLAPPLRLDGRMLVDVLEDIARQSGRQLEFADAGVRETCRHVALKGPLLDLPIGDRLYAVLATTGFEAVESGDRILIRGEASD